MVLIGKAFCCTTISSYRLCAGVFILFYFNFINCPFRIQGTSDRFILPVASELNVSVSFGKQDQWLARFTLNISGMFVMEGNHIVIGMEMGTGRGWE